MEHLYHPINGKALNDVLTMVLGTPMTEALAKMYQLVDQATKDGYALGLEDGQADKDGATEAAFDTGYDEGYCHGVTDARTRPSAADETIQDIIADAAQFALNGEYDASLVTDSGDETSSVELYVQEQVQDEA